MAKKQREVYVLKYIINGRCGQFAFASYHEAVKFAVEQYAECLEGSIESERKIAMLRYALENMGMSIELRSPEAKIDIESYDIVESYGNARYVVARCNTL